MIHNQQNCKIDSDCVFMTNGGEYSFLFDEPINREGLEVIQKKTDEYCKKHHVNTCSQIKIEKSMPVYCANDKCHTPYEQIISA